MNVFEIPIFAPVTYQDYVESANTGTSGFGKPVAALLH